MKVPLSIGDGSPALASLFSSLCLGLCGLIAFMNLFMSIMK